MLIKIIQCAIDKIQKAIAAPVGRELAIKCFIPRPLLISSIRIDSELKQNGPIARSATQPTHERFDLWEEQKAECHDIDSLHSSSGAIGNRTPQATELA
jgi:hypothetical protein